MRDTEKGKLLYTGKKFKKDYFPKGVTLVVDESMS